MENARTRLKNVGLPVTAQRLSILKHITKHPHSTADTIANLVREELGTVSRQAIYNSVNALVEKSLLRKIEPAGSPARYEDRVGDNHHHIICRICGKTEDVDCAVGHAPCLTPSNDHGFIVDEAEVIYWGICPDCQ